MPHKTHAWSPAQKFPSAEAQSQIPAPSQRSFHNTCERGYDFQRSAIYTDGGTRVENGETLAGWGVIARSHHGRIHIVFGPVITTEAHPAFSGARTHSSNTAEMTAMIEAFSFLGLRGPVARDTNSCPFYDSKHAAGGCLGTIQARTHVQLALACQQLMLSVQHRLRLTMQHVHGHAGNLCNECADHAAALGSVGLVSSATSPLGGFVTISTPLPVVLIVTATVKSWKNCVALELRQHRYLRTGVCDVFLIGFYVTLTHAFASLVVLLSAFFPRCPSFFLYCTRLLLR